MKTKTIYYRITHSDGDFYQSESLDEIMSWIPTSYKKTNDTSKCNHLTWAFEKFENIEEEYGDNTELIESYYFVGKTTIKPYKP
jgi:hypothetical protein